jgi:hypothetical protein
MLRQLHTHNEVNQFAFLIQVRLLVNVLIKHLKKCLI